MTLHVPTILITSAMMSALVAGLQCIVSCRLRSAALAYWAGGNVAAAIGGTLLGLRPAVPAAVSIVLGNGFIFLALGLMLCGVRVFDNRRPLLGLIILFVGACTGLLVASLALGDNLGERITIVSLFISIWCAISAHTLLKVPFGQQRAAARALCAGLLAVFSGLYALRGVGVASGWVSSVDALNGLPQALLTLSGLAMATGWNFCSLFMVLDRLASTDDLTGLLNRRTTLRQGRLLLEEACARRQPLSLMMVDLDHFKSVNDRFGHHVGDAVLQRFAEVARRELRSGDLIGRLGGEEFCVILPGVDADAGREVGERLRRTTERELRSVQHLPVNATVTVGIATLSPGPQASEALSSLMRAADEALYRAKAQGRNRVLCAPGRYESAQFPRQVAAPA